MAIREEARENWGTRAGFVLAAIGSAVGLGNLWGFPYKVYSFGGAAFLIPYVLAMFLVGLPLMILEFSLGHMSQRAAPDAMRHVHRRSEFVGWWQLILSFVIITYYAVVLAWCVSFLFYSIQGIVSHGGQLPWAGKGIEGVQKAEGFFFKDYLSFNESSWLGRVQWHIVLALLVTWAAMYFCVFRGVRLVSKVVLLTVPLPWLMLLILTVRGLTLDGATRGLSFFLEPNWSQLLQPATWRWAFGQTFFSLSLAFGVMVTYASFLHRKSDLNNNAAIIGLADLGTSFVAGLAVFATLGAMAVASQQAGAAVAVQDVARGGPGLAFAAFPYALAQLPYSAWFSMVFFVALLTLGIDSAFSITESIIAGVVDKTGWRRGRVVLVLHLVGLGLGLIYCTRNGLTWLGTMDDFINGPFGIALLGLVECLVIGWLFHLARLRRHANERSDWTLGGWWGLLVRVVIPVVLAALIAWSLFDSLASPAGFVRKFRADPAAVTVPATPAEAIADQAVLQLQFSGGKDFANVARDVVLSAKAETHAGWQIATEPGRFAPIPEGELLVAQVAGRELRHEAAGLAPASAFVVRCRWTTDPKAGQEPWTILKEPIVTHRMRDGVHLTNLIGVIVFALAPVLGIVIMCLRFKGAPGGPADPDPADPPGQTAGGVLALLLGGLGLALVAWGFSPILRIDALIRLAEPVGGLAFKSTVILLGAAGSGALGLLIGGLAVQSAESRGQRASRAAQIAAMFSAVAVGLAAGLGLAMLTRVRQVRVTPFRDTGVLSGTAYVVLALAFLLIVGGLFWCFYRAFKAAGSTGETQLPEA